MTNETVQLKKEDLLKAYEEGCSQTREVLENLYPEVFRIGKQTLAQELRSVCDISCIKIISSPNGGNILAIKGPVSTESFPNLYKWNLNHSSEFFAAALKMAMDYADDPNVFKDGKTLVHFLDKISDKEDD